MLYNKNNKKGFTLVELIVVITILSILWLIAFISLQWYSKASRDSKRIADMSRIKTSLELFQIESWKYPEPSWVIDMTYSGTIAAWHQGTFWDSTYRNVEKLDKIPLDPVTESEYTYSVTNSRKEFQIGWILETDDFVLGDTNNVNAWENLARAKIAWSYNWSILKVSKWNKLYLLSVPSIICADGFTIEECLNQNKLVFDWFRNLPPSYKATQYKQLWEWSTLNLVNSSADILMYSWDGSELNADTDEGKAIRKAMVEKLQLAYKDTNIANRDWIRQLVNVDTTNLTDVESLWISIVNNKINSAMITASKLSVEDTWVVGCGEWYELNNWECIALPMEKTVDATGTVSGMCIWGWWFSTSNGFLTYAGWLKGGTYNWTITLNNAGTIRGVNVRWGNKWNWADGDPVGVAFTYTIDGTNWLPIEFTESISSPLNTESETDWLKVFELKTPTKVKSVRASFNGVSGGNQSSSCGKQFGFAFALMQ